MMDILELSRKMEADLLESRTSGSSSGSSKLTRHQTGNKKKTPGTDDADNLQPKRRLKKVGNLLRDSDNSLSPRLTRFQLSNNKKPVAVVGEDLVDTQPKRKQKKVDEVEKIYLNKEAKVVHKNLETIYEFPVWKKGNTVLVGSSKVKRSIYLDREFRITSKQKSKLRKMKIKRLGKKKSRPFKMSDDEFKRKMLRIENYLDGDDVKIECPKEDCDVDFDANCNNQDCNNSESESVGSCAKEESSGSVGSSVKEETNGSGGVYNDFDWCE